jgi:hypothetical protein
MPIKKSIKKKSPVKKTSIKKKPVKKACGKKMSVKKKPVNKNTKKQTGGETIEKIPTDLYYNLFTENLTIKDIVNLCNINRSFKTFCSSNASFIHNIKTKALKKFLRDNDNKIKEFAVKNKFRYEGMDFYGPIMTIENKFTVTLLYLVNNGLYDTATLYLTSPHFLFKQPVGHSIFSHKLFKAFPKKIVELYMERLPPILDLFGYDNTEDFFEDLPIQSFENKYLQEYIKKKLRK